MSKLVRTYQYSNETLEALKDKMPNFYAYVRKHGKSLNGKTECEAIIAYPGVYANMEDLDNDYKYCLENDLLCNEIAPEDTSDMLYATPSE